VHDLLKPFPIAWQQSFDLVHQRFIFPIFKDNEVNQVVENLVSCVKPGGWIQFVEPDASTKLSESKATWFLKLHNLAEKVMTNPNVAQKLKSRLGELGMSNIQEEVIDMGVGRLHENRELGIRGAKNMKAMLDRFMSVTRYIVRSKRNRFLHEIRLTNRTVMRRFV
jgi:gliotoxin biosynthesis N-methyltransferase